MTGHLFFTSAGLFERSFVRAGRVARVAVDLGVRERLAEPSGATNPQQSVGSSSPRDRQTATFLILFRLVRMRNGAGIKRGWDPDFPGVSAPQHHRVARTISARAWRIASASASLPSATSSASPMSLGPVTEPNCGSSSTFTPFPARIASPQAPRTAAQ